MQTTTESTAHEHHGHTQPLPAGVEAIDLEHDIDSQRTMFWLVTCTVGVFAAVWLLYLLYGAVIAGERERKIDLLEPVELQELRKTENATLSGQNGGLTIDEAMRRRVEEHK